IDDFYEHKDSEATQDDEKDDEVNKAKTDDDDDDDGSQFSMEFRKKKESPIPTYPLDPIGLSTSIPVHTTYPTSSTSTIQPPHQTEPSNEEMNHNKPPTPSVADDFIKSHPLKSDNQLHPLPSPNNEEDPQEPSPPKNTTNPTVQTQLLKSDYRIKQLQQTCRGDALHKRPHDDHKDDDQHEWEKAKRPRTTGNFYSMPTKNTNTEEVNVLENKLSSQNDKETSQEPSTAINEVP
ncbi:hypothetical protein Tco_1387560, partial [Tanacetum coccineum]